MILKTHWTLEYIYTLPLDTFYELLIDISDIESGKPGQRSGKSKKSEIEKFTSYLDPA
jgi:hypothetical protein